MTKLKFIFPLLALFFIISCASAPEETPIPLEEEPIEQVIEPESTPEVIEESKTIEVEPEPVIIEEEIIEEVEIIEEIYVPEPLDESLLAKARKEIFKAQEARAQTYFPERLKNLRSKLSEAEQLKESDPDRSRELLKEISLESEKLTEDSLNALKIACLNILQNKTESLLNIKADKYTPVEFDISQNQTEETITAFNEDDFTKSLALYRVAYTSLTNLFNSLNKNMGFIESLIKSIESKRVEGESINVEQWAPIEYQEAVESYMVSQDLLYKQFDAVSGEQNLRETLFLAKKAIAQAYINIDVAETDAEILALMDELEDASDLTVLDREDNIISPEKWNGPINLIEKPIEAKVEKEDTSVLEPVDLEEDVEVEYPEVSKLKISIYEGRTQVLGITEERRSLLAEAKDLWSLGMEARNNGDLITAREYLAKSKIFLDEYKSMAVTYIYTVVLNPEERDCLWRISEKDKYYGDPLLWQNIWERNKKLIQDPDLIYPGWKLIIPPLD